MSLPELRFGDQLQLDMGEPWGGISPRLLCRVNLDSRFGGTGRASRDAPVVKSSDRREVLQLWLFSDEADS